MSQYEEAAFKALMKDNERLKAEAIELKEHHFQQMKQGLEANEKLKAERDHAILQAQIWKQEAMTHKSTVQECYQICTGGSGESGDWYGAEPVRALLSSLAAEQKKVEMLREALEKISVNMGASDYVASVAIEALAATEKEK